MNPELADLLRSYRTRRPIKAGEILLPQDLAVALVDDLERLGIEIYGVDFWRVHEGNVVEIPWGGDSPGANVEERAESARKSIVEEWPADAAYASLVFPGYFIDEG